MAGKYLLTKRITLGLEYQYENYQSDDWATDNVDPSSAVIGAAITLSGSVPDYRAHLVFMSLTLNF